DRVMHARQKSDLQLCAHAVCRSDEHRFTQRRKRGAEHPAETPDLGERALIESRARETFDLLDGGVRRINVNARVAVSNGWIHMASIPSSIGAPSVQPPAPSYGF